jgi:hypothetical protein
MVRSHHVVQALNDKTPQDSSCGALLEKVRPEGRRIIESGVITNRFDRAAFFGFLAARFLFRRSGLLVNEGVAAVVIAFEIIRSGFAAEIAVNALVVHVVFAGDIFRIFVCNVSHKIY